MLAVRETTVAPSTLHSTRPSTPAARPIHNTSPPLASSQFLPSGQLYAIGGSANLQTDFTVDPYVSIPDEYKRTMVAFEVYARTHPQRIRAAPSGARTWRGSFALLGGSFALLGWLLLSPPRCHV